MGIKVDLLEVTGIDLVLDVLLELAVESLFIVIGETLHVLSDVTAQDVLAESLSVQLFGLHVVTGETLAGVRDEDTTVGGTLHSTEDTGTGGSTRKTDIKEGLEGAAGALVGLDGFGEAVLAVSFLDTLEVLVKTKLLESATGEEETGSVGGGPVGQTLGDTVALELVRVGAGKNLVTDDLGVDDLSDDVAVGEADDQAVLGRVELVLGLRNQALASVVVGLTLPSTLELRLVATVENVLVYIYIYI